MTLVVACGNTNCRLAVFSGRRVARTRVVPTARVLDAPARLFTGLAADDAALASVVPAATRPLARALKELTGRPPLVVGNRTRTRLRIRYNRTNLGADRLCAAEGARSLWPGDLAVVDFGTAVTVNFVSREDVFEGGVILPGPALALAALAGGTARLPRALPRPVADPRCRDTRPALQAGVLLSVAGGVERALAEVERRTGRRWKLVATGGGAPTFRRHLPRIEAVDPLLALRGLAGLLALNRAG